MFKKLLEKKKDGGGGCSIITILQMGKQTQ